MSATDHHRTIEAVWRIESARVIAGLTRLTRDVGQAEDLARDLATLEQTVPDLNSNLDDPIGDDLLRLVFISCHPILSTESRAALTLRLRPAAWSTSYSPTQR